MNEQENAKQATQSGSASEEAEKLAGSGLTLEIERPRFKEKQADFCAIDSDTEIFSETLTAEYPILGDISEMLTSGNNTVKFDQHIVSKKIDEEWVSAIEAGMIYLDEAIRNPRVEIIEVEEIKPIELTKNVSERSIKHLSQHTDMINDYDPETGEVTPTKILNVFREDNMLTYENKFVNTLVRTLHSFINRRYKELAKQNILSGSRLELQSDFKTPTADGKLTFSIELTEAARETSARTKTVYFDPLLKRIEKLYEVISGYLTSDFAKALGNNTIRPPVKRTNAISKNKNLRQCLALWDYIQSYHKIGYEIEQQQISGEPDKDYLEKLYSMLSLQYVTYKAALEKGLEPDEWDAEGAQLPYSLEGEDRDYDDYGIYDPPYGRVVPVSRFVKQPKISSKETELRSELLVALNASYYFERIAPVLGAERLRRYFGTGMTIDNVLTFAEVTRERRAAEIMASSERRERLLKKENEYLEIKAKREAEARARSELLETVESIARAEAIRAIGKRRLKERRFKLIADRAERRELDRLALPFIREARAELEKETELNRRYYDFAMELSAFEAELVWDAHLRKLAEEKARRLEALREADGECTELISDARYLFDYENEQLEESEQLALIAAEYELEEVLKREDPHSFRFEQEKRANEERRQQYESERKQEADARRERERIDIEKRQERIAEQQQRDDMRHQRLEGERLAEEERRREKEAEATANERLKEEGYRVAEKQAEEERKRREREIAEAERAAKAASAAKPETAIETELENEAAQAVEAEPENEAAQAVEAQPENEAEQAVEAQPEDEAAQAVEAQSENEAAQVVEAKSENEAAQAVEAKPENKAAQAVKAKPENEVAPASEPKKEAVRASEAVAPKKQGAQKPAGAKPQTAAPKKDPDTERLNKNERSKQSQDARNERYIKDLLKKEEEESTRKADAGAIGAIRRGIRSLFRGK